MHKTLEALERFSVVEHKLRKPLAINSSFEKHARKNVLDRFCAIAGIEIADRDVRIKDRSSELDEHRSDGRFPHCY